MNQRTLTGRRLALVGLPAAAALVLGTAGFAYAAENTTSARSSSSSTSQTGQHGDHDGGDHAEAKPSYRSSVTTTAKEDAGDGTAAELALAKLAKIDLGAAAKAGASAVPDGSAIDVSLENEAGNVVYAVDVVTPSQETEVVVDAGTGAVLAKTAETHGD